MARYPRKAYRPIPPRLDGVERKFPDLRDWGPGWPDCQRSTFVRVEAGGVRVRVRREVAQLVELLIERTESLGYDVKPRDEKCGGTWGAFCRKIRGSDPPSPSWHSWGLAIDINAKCNPMSSRWRCNIPPDIVELWESSGFYWGGRFDGRYDPMHFEYMGSPDEVAADVENARAAFLRLRG